jgi:hypothetical protein
VCERTEILGDINNVHLQVIECLNNCQEQKYTGIPDKTINLTKVKNVTVIQQQRILFGRLLLRTKINRRKSQTVGIIVKKKNIQVEL